MKQIRPFISSLAACGIALAMVTSLAAQTAQQGFAKVVRISGSARYMPSGASSWEPLKVGATLSPGTVVQTASGSYVDLALNSNASAGRVGSAGAPSAAASTVAYRPSVQQNMVRVFENTVLGLDTLTVDQTGADTVSDTELDLKAGKIFGTVKKLGAASKYEVKIPNGVAGIRGTMYFLTADGLLQVVDGQVVLAYVGPNGTAMTQVVDAGYQFDIKTGQLTRFTPPALPPYGTSTMGPTVFTVDHTIYYVSPTSSGNSGPVFDSTAR